jgi:hypothetical protein
MPHARNGRVQPDRKALDVDIARLRDLDVGALRARWHVLAALGQHGMDGRPGFVQVDPNVLTQFVIVFRTSHTMTF